MWKIRKLVKQGDYLYAVVPEHPNRDKHNYVYAHRVIVENNIGRLLDKDEVVHHINGIKNDNRVENLEVMTPEKHGKLHGSRRKVRRIRLICPKCSVVFEKPYRQTHFGKKQGNATFCSSSCRAKFGSTRDISNSQVILADFYI